MKADAQEAGVSVTTAFSMRHKLHDAFSLLKKPCLSGDVQMDALHLSISLKGTKPQSMPRLSKTRGKTSAFRGISHHMVSSFQVKNEFSA